MKNLLIALAIGLILPASAMAGNGGGTKSTGTGIKVTNKAARTLAVITGNGGIDPQTITLEEFKKLGGKVLGVGESTVFNLKAGSHTVLGVLINADGSRTNEGLNDFTVKAGKLTHVTANGNLFDTPEFKLAK